MTKKVVIGFEVPETFKTRAVKAAKNYRIDGILQPVKLSMLCRIAVTNLIYDIENYKAPKEGDLK